jgi:hypothetical protein
MAKRRARDDAARDSFDEEELDEYVPTRELGRRRSRRRGRPWGKLLVVLVILLAVVVALPTIVANTPLLNSLLAKAVPDGSLRVTASGASLGWFSAPSLSGV